MDKVRFAPSPTGYLHIGGARTCLFNWLYARSQGANFVLRIEDTDLARSKKEFLDEILESLKWLGLDWDELYYQSERFELYRTQAKALLRAGRAYVADDGSGAIFLKMPQEVVAIQDLIHGEIKFDTTLIKDQVLIKSDQSPTYNFACVVDDATMGVNTIIRGDDHISNTPKQLVIYEALGFQIPQFAHIPMILGKGGGRLSKRTGATAISDYRKMGFLPEALVNYLLLLGWSPGNNREIIALHEAAEKFRLKDANKTAATFDMDKLTWLNGQYIRQCDDEALSERITPFLQTRFGKEVENFDGKRVKAIIKLYRERVSFLNDLAASFETFLIQDVVFDEAAKQKHFSKNLSREFEVLYKRFEQMSSFDAAGIEETFRGTVKELGCSVKMLIHPLRFLLSGTTAGPGMFEFIEVLGRQKTLERIRRGINIYKEIL